MSLVPRDPIYISAAEALDLYGEMMGIREVDPANFVRDWNLLESALACPQHAALYENAGLARQVATLLWGLVKNHPFVDGNKRAAHLIAVTFIEVNGCELRATEDEQFDLMLNAAAGALDLDAVDGWIQEHLTRPDTGSE